MDKPILDPDEPRPNLRPSLAEEQRLAFEKDRERVRRPTLSLRWDGRLFRN